MSDKPGTSKAHKEKSRLAIVLELAEILSLESGGKCKKSEESECLEPTPKYTFKCHSCIFPA